MVDIQSLVDTLSSLDEENLVNVISSVLQARPEAAPPVVTFSIPDLTYPPSKALLERRSQGVIKSFNHNTGFGFIDCPELHSVFGNDVFLHSKQLGEFAPGAAVTFAVCLSKDNKPQAYDLQPQGGKGGCKGGFAGCKGGVDMGMQGGMQYVMMDQWQMMQGGKMGGWGGCGFKGKMDDGGKGKKGWDKGAGGGKGGKSGEEVKALMPAGVEPFQELGQFTGIVKSFSMKSGYGFITCAEVQEMGFANDVFLHHQQVGECEPGSEVTFTCYLNKNGQPQAKDVATADAGPATKRFRMG